MHKTSGFDSIVVSLNYLNILNLGFNDYGFSFTSRDDSKIEFRLNTN